MHQPTILLSAALVLSTMAAGSSAPSASCGNDSAIVIYTSDCQGRPNQCTYSVVTDHYDLSTGLLNGTIGWNRTDTFYTTGGSILEIRTLKGSTAGWQNNRSELRSYTSGGLLSDCHVRNWNGTSWETTGWTNLAYDATDHLIQQAEYTNQGGVWSNSYKEEYGYSNGLPSWHNRFRGDGVSWLPETRFEYGYIGGVRTSLDMKRWDLPTASWAGADRASFQLLNGNWCARIHSTMPGTINGIPSSEVYDDYDTLDRVMHHYEFITTITATEQTASSTEEFYVSINGERVPDRTICIDQYQWWNGSWEPLINCCTNTYRYSPMGHLEEHLIECAEGGRGYTYYRYDSFGRLITETFHANSHSELVTRDYQVEYRYPDPATIDLFVAPQPVIPLPCRGSTVRPMIGVTGGCDGKRYRWTPSRGLSSDTVLIPDILVEDSITYTLTVTDDAGHMKAVSLTVGPVDVRPEIEDISACREQIVLHAQAGVQSGEFTWFYNGNPVRSDEFLLVEQPGTYYVTNGYWQQIPSYELTENCLSASLPLYIAELPGPVQSEHFIELCAGDEYVLPDGTVPAQSGVYTTHIQTVAGCDSVVRVYLTVHPEISPMILSNGNTLFTPADGEYFVWYHEGQPLAAGDEANSIQAEEEGAYNVLVIDTNGCEGVSATFILTISDLDADLDEMPVLVYPNPVVNTLHVLFHFEPDEPTHFSLYDISGKCVREVLLDQRANHIDVSNLSNGSYLVVMKNGEEVLRKTVSISH